MAKDIKEKLNENRIIFITSDMSLDDISETIIKLLAWNKEDDKQMINLYLSSECRNPMQIMPIYDVLIKINNPISVFCFGHVGGLAPIFLSFPNRGKRYILKHTTVSLEQPYGVIDTGNNQQTEIRIEANRTTEIRNMFEEILSKGINKPIMDIHDVTEVDKEYSAAEALSFGLVDEVLE